MVHTDSNLTPRESAAGAVLQSVAADVDALRRLLHDAIDMPAEEQARTLAAAQALAGRVGLVADSAAHALGRTRHQRSAQWLADGIDADALALLTRKPAHA